MGPWSYQEDNPSASAAAAAGLPVGMLLEDQVAGSNPNIVTQTATLLDITSVGLLLPVDPHEEWHRARES